MEEIYLNKGKFDLNHCDQTRTGVEKSSLTKTETKFLWHMEDISEARKICHFKPGQTPKTIAGSVITWNPTPPCWNGDI